MGFDHFKAFTRSSPSQKTPFGLPLLSRCLLPPLLTVINEGPESPPLHEECGAQPQSFEPEEPAHQSLELMIRPGERHWPSCGSTPPGSLNSPLTRGFLSLRTPLELGLSQGLAVDPAAAPQGSWAKSPVQVLSDLSQPSWGLRPILITDC
jgi:hypothetical protein